MNSRITQASDLQAFLSACRERVDRLLRSLLGVNDETRLEQAMAYATLSGGKRVRPVLVYGAARAVKADPDVADAPACAVELIHCYSLVHDDLPAMDDDDLRRGKPTVHRAFDEATAILVGDALLPLAFETVCAATDHGLAPSACTEMVRLLAQAAGHRGMVKGQAVDYEAMGKSLTLPELEAMHRLKTGALIRASVSLGALCAPRPEQAHIEALRLYADCIGLAFQIQDDILDETADSAQSGKTRGADRARNKPTYTSLLGLSGARDKTAALQEEAIAALRIFGQEADMLRDLARFIVERTH